MKRPEDLVPVFKALGDPTRLKILELLRARGKSCCDLISREERGLCACDIEEAVGLSQAAISHHMDLLRRAGLVDAEKRVRWLDDGDATAHFGGLNLDPLSTALIFEELGRGAVPSPLIASSVIAACLLRGCHASSS